MGNFKDWYLKMMRQEDNLSEAINYARAAGYDVGQLIQERLLKGESNEAPCNQDD